WHEALAIIHRCVRVAGVVSAMVFVGRVAISITVGVAYVVGSILVTVGGITTLDWFILSTVVSYVVGVVVGRVIRGRWRFGWRRDFIGGAVRFFRSAVEIARRILQIFLFLTQSIELVFELANAQLNAF